MKSVSYDNRKCASWYTVNAGWMYVPSTYEYILTSHIYPAKSLWKIVSLLHWAISSVPCGPSCEPSPSNCSNDTCSVQTSPFKTSHTTGVCELSLRHINKNKSVRSPIIFEQQKPETSSTIHEDIILRFVLCILLALKYR